MIFNVGKLDVGGLLCCECKAATWRMSSSVSCLAIERPYIFCLIISSNCQRILTLLPSVATGALVVTQTWICYSIDTSLMLAL